MRSALATACVTAVVIASAQTASAQEAPRDAAELAMHEARGALQVGDAELAIDILEEARRSSSDPRLDHELYVAYEQARRHEDAIAALERYLATDPPIAPDERDTLEGHLADLRALVGPAPSGDPWADPAVPVIGWTLLAAGIAGILTFATGATMVLVFENNLSRECREEGICEPDAYVPIDTAWAVAWTGLASGVVFAAVGGALLVLSGEHQRGGSRSLPPDLDPTLQRPFSLRPWLGPDGGGLSMRLVF